VNTFSRLILLGSLFLGSCAQQPIQSVQGRNLEVFVYGIPKDVSFVTISVKPVNNEVTVKGSGSARVRSLELNVDKAHQHLANLQVLIEDMRS
jgi:hypothetical protein